MTRRYSSVMLKAALLTAVGVAVLAGWCFASEFSALLVEKYGETVNKNFVYVKGDKLRRELRKPGINEIVIYRPDKGLAWIMQPDEKTYIEIPFKSNPWMDYNYIDTNENIATKKFVGKENASGYMCDKYVVTFKNKPDVSQVIWLSPQLEYPIKIVTRTPRGNSSMEYTIIRKKQLDDSLFELPEDYKPMNEEAE